VSTQNRTHCSGKEDPWDALLASLPFREHPRCPEIGGELQDHQGRPPSAEGSEERIMPPSARQTIPHPYLSPHSTTTGDSGSKTAHGNPDGSFQHGKALHDRGLAIARQFIYM